MFSTFSISLQYAVLTAGCATVAQGDSRPVLSGRFHLYCPSQCAAWAEEKVAPRVHHLQFPTSGPLELFNQWFVGRALAADVLSLSLATKGSRGATRDVAKAKLLTTIHGGLSFGRLLLAYRSSEHLLWWVDLTQLLYHFYQGLASLVAGGALVETFGDLCLKPCCCV